MSGSVLRLAFAMGIPKGATHGGDMYAAARGLGPGVPGLLDFSASINPLGPSAAARRTIGRANDLLCHYPPLLHKDVSTTMIYTHVLNREGKGVRRSADELLQALNPSQPE